MNRKLVLFNSNSSGSGKVTALLTTLESTAFVIAPNVSRQRFAQLERLGAMTTAPLGQAAMLIAVMVLQLMPKQNKQTTLVKSKIKSLNCIHVSESFTTISDDARVWFDLVDSFQVLAKIRLGLEGHFAVLH